MELERTAFESKLTPGSIAHGHRVIDHSTHTDHTPAFPNSDFSKSPQAETLSASFLPAITTCRTPTTMICLKFSTILGGQDAALKTTVSTLSAAQTFSNLRCSPSEHATTFRRDSPTRATSFFGPRRLPLDRCGFAS